MLISQKKMYMARMREVLHESPDGAFGNPSVQTVWDEFLTWLINEGGGCTLDEMKAWLRWPPLDALLLDASSMLDAIQTDINQVFGREVLSVNKGNVTTIRINVDRLEEYFRVMDARRATDDIASARLNDNQQRLDQLSKALGIADEIGDDVLADALRDAIDGLDRSRRTRMFRVGQVVSGVHYDNDTLRYFWIVQASMRAIIALEVEHYKDGQWRLACNRHRDPYRVVDLSAITEDDMEEITNATDLEVVADRLPVIMGAVERS